jgi:hypothetical protein
VSSSSSSTISLGFYTVSLNLPSSLFSLILQCIQNYAKFPQFLHWFLSETNTLNNLNGIRSRSSWKPTQKVTHTFLLLNSCFFIFYIHQCMLCDYSRESYSNKIIRIFIIFNSLLCNNVPVIVQISNWDSIVFNSLVYTNNVPLIFNFVCANEYLLYIIYHHFSNLL